MALSNLAALNDANQARLLAIPGIGVKLLLAKELRILPFYIAALMRKLSLHDDTDMIIQNCTQAVSQYLESAKNLARTFILNRYAAKQFLSNQHSSNRKAHGFKGLDDYLLRDIRSFLFPEGIDTYITALKEAQAVASPIGNKQLFFRALLKHGTLLPYKHVPEAVIQKVVNTSLATYLGGLFNGFFNY